MSSILKFSLLKISLETPERSFICEEKIAAKHHGIYEIPHPPPPPPTCLEPWGARVARWWENSPPTNNVVRVQIPTSTSNVGWVCCWFSPLLREVFLWILRFSLLLNQHFQIPILPGTLLIGLKQQCFNLEISATLRLTWAWYLGIVSREQLTYTRNFTKLRRRRKGERLKHNRLQLAKQQLRLHVHHGFCIFLRCPYTTTTRNWSNFELTGLKTGTTRR